MGSLVNRLEEVLQAAFLATGWTLQGSSSSVNMVASRKGQRCVVEWKVASGRPRLEVLQHGLAAAALIAKRHASDMGDAGGGQIKALAVVGAEKISKGMLGKLVAFAKAYLDGAPWCIADACGVRAVQGIDLPVVDRPQPQRAESRPVSVSPFSDAGQWLLKVLLAGDLDARWIRHGGHQVQFQTSKELADFSRVSQPAVSVVLRELESRGFLKRRPFIKLVDRPRLLHEWAASLLAKPLIEVPARSMFGSRDPVGTLSKSLVQGNACLGLFSACVAHGIDFVRGAPDFVLVNEVTTKTLNDLGLVEADGRDSAQFIVRQARYPKAVFRGVPDRQPQTADGIQCWLDLVHHPVRGEELARELWHAMDMPFEQP